MPYRPATITFPERLWTQGENGLWSSRPPTREDYRLRGRLLKELNCVSNADYIPFKEKENENEQAE